MKNDKNNPRHNWMGVEYGVTILHITPHSSCSVLACVAKGIPIFFSGGESNPVSTFPWRYKMHNF